MGPDGASSLWALAFLQSGRAAGEPYTLRSPLAGYTYRYLVPAPKSLQAYLGASSGHLGLCASSRSPVPASHCSSHHAPAASCMARPCPIPTLPCLQVQVSSTQHPTTCSSVTITTTHHPSSLLSLPIFQPPHSSSPHSVPPQYILFLTPFLNIGIAYFQRTSICLPVDHLGWTGLDWIGLKTHWTNPQLEINPGLESQNRYRLLHLAGGLRRTSHSIHRIYPPCFPASRAPPPN